MPDRSLTERFGVRVSGGETVFRQGDPGGSVYVIRAGKVRVLKEAHGRQLMVTTLGPGDFFGEMAVMTGKPRSATVEVLEDAELLRVPAAKIEEMVAGSGEVGIRLVRRLVERLDEANRLIDVLLEDDVTARVIVELQHRIDGAEGSIAPDITEAELALRLGIDQDRVRTSLRRLKRVGLLDVQSGFVLIRDPARLEEFLEFVRNTRKR